MDSARLKKYRSALVEMRDRLIPDLSRIEQAVAEDAHPPGETSNAPTHLGNIASTNPEGNIALRTPNKAFWNKSRPRSSELTTVRMAHAKNVAERSLGSDWTRCRTRPIASSVPSSSNSSGDAQVHDPLPPLASPVGGRIRYNGSNHVFQVLEYSR